MDLLTAIKAFLKDRFNLDDDKATEEETIESIRKGVEFKGTNLWILIFAVIIASIGLNVNSTAVIIGAMLISPIMGPIMGLGLGTGINDFELIKKSAYNLGVAALIGLFSSALYFLVSPLDEAQSELLARTTPTIWDVLIAFFGGLAGIIAGSRKEKSNVVPGVAIATALMPPLCTAGYGLASGNFYFFLGAAYLFFINSIFISLSTFLIVRFLRFKKKEFLDKEKETRVSRTITLVVVLTVVPSIWLAYRIVNQSIFTANARQYVAQEFKFRNTFVLEREFKVEDGQERIEVSLTGQVLDSADLQLLKDKLPFHDLEDAVLVVRQGEKLDQTTDINVLKSTVLKELVDQQQSQLAEKEMVIDRLENQLKNATLETGFMQSFSGEVLALFPGVESISIAKGIAVNMGNSRQDTTKVALLRFTQEPDETDVMKMRAWLKARLETDNLKLIIETSKSDSTND